MDINKDINKDIKSLFEPKLYLSKVNFFIKVLIILLILTGISLMITALKNKNDLEEFFVIPLFLSFLDFLFVFLIINKVIGYKVYYTGNNLIILRFTKEIAKINLKSAQISYKKRTFYEVIEFYENSKLVFTVPSYWFKYNDFENLKTSLIQVKKYLKLLEQ